MISFDDGNFPCDYIFMILYFSATGNTEFIAKELAKLTDDTCLNLLEKIQKSDYSEIHSEKPFVICAPIYVCELPYFLVQFLKKTKLTGNREIYCILSSGGYSGHACLQAKTIARRQKLIYKGSADIVMPRNYIASDLYPMLSVEENKDRISKAKTAIADAAQIIKAGGVLKKRHVFLFESLIIMPVAGPWRKFVLTAKAFYAKDSCIGCGKCAKVCPLNNINIVEKKPEWGKKCTHCMACIANCPKESIEYGKTTVGKERYLFKKYSD